MENNSQTPDLAKAIKEARSLFDELTPVEQWRLDSDKEGVKIYTRQDPITSLSMARGQSTISKPLSAVLPAIQDPKIVSQWDDSIAINENLEVQGDYVIGRSVDKKKTFVTQRETLMTTTTLKLDNGSTFIGGQSIEHPKYPPTSEYVRAHIHIWGWLLTPVKGDSNKTDVLYMIYLDPKGWVPTAVFNAFVGEQAQNARKLKSFLEKK